MTALSIQVPYPIFSDKDGSPLQNGYVWIGTQYLEPRTNPVTVYFDEALTQIAPQPLRTLNGYVYNAGSPAQLYVNGVNFSILVQNKNGSMVYSFPDGSGINPDSNGVSYTPSGAGAVATTVQTKLRESVSVKDFGAVGDGVTDDTAAIQAAIDSVALVGGGVVTAGVGSYLIAGDGIINIKAGVTLRGVGAPTRFISGTGGKNGHHSFVYLKDGASIEDCRISGSNYIKQSGGADYICYNKIGITTQGATLGKGFRISRVGFEKLANSHIFVFNSHSDILIDGCYTFGTQVGGYADVDGANLVGNWNATFSSASCIAGTQVYCLTNFYNSGSNTTDVVITNGRHLNICDAFVGVNSGSTRHTISDNIFVKDTVGYYGGWGADLNGAGDFCVITGNYIAGGSVGVHLGGSNNTTVVGNTIVTERGVWLDDPNSVRNTITGNTIFLTNNMASITPKVGVRFDGAQNNTVVGNTIDGNGIAGAKGVLFSTSGSVTVGNSILSNTFQNLDTGVESADASNDGNFSFSNSFRTVTTTFPRQINNNLFTSVKGISGTTSNCNNLGGTVVVSAAATSQAVSFTNAEPDTSYRIMLSIRSSSGTPAAGAFTLLAPSSLTTAGFTVNVQAAPGVGNSVSFNWFLFRA